MGFMRMKGVEGLVYVPDGEEGPKKHPCEDCHFCQWCSDNRCSLCLEGKACRKTGKPDAAPGDKLDGTCPRRRG